MINEPRRCPIPCARPLCILLAAFLPLGCDNNPQTATKPAVQDVVVAERAGNEPSPPPESNALANASNPDADHPVVAEPAKDASRPRATVSADQEKEIRDLIEQLVFADHDAEREPLLRPGVRDDSEAYRDRFEACQKAFQKLRELKDVAIPFLVEHLKDGRQSVPFRNHFLGQSVGDACYWNIYFQLQDRPDDYSSYGYSRKGRDGDKHPKPYWKGTPFGDAGGLVKWLEENKALTYTEKQIKCLRWLLEKEKAIGASNAKSYFENILPLEIRIAERRLEAGEDVQDELDHLRMIRDKKLVAEIPRELLPDE